MARTISQIQAAIATDRALRPELAGLTSPSATAVFRLVEFVVATATWALETILDRFLDDVDATIARAPAGTAAWYADRALEFQLDDPLVLLDTGKPGYAVGTTGERIVTRATAKENDTTGRLFIKVAKDDGSGGLAPLDAGTELVQLRGYFDRLRFAGTRLEIVSREADVLQVYGSIFYDPLLPVAGLKVAVAAAISAYLANLEFDGLLYVARLEDAIQAVAGVKDVQLSLVLALADGVATDVQRVYETAAGYIVADTDPAALFAFIPLS